ncbi:MAG: DUF3617 domain-containing protein [Methylotenera sp.]|nr:DUF3617 domain-containing protein [Methylotenera sp.]
MYKSLFVFVSITLLFLPVANSAETNMRPGLWEITTTSDLLWLVPKIPQDQMDSLKDFAKEYGFDIPKIQNGAATSSTCITQEMANQKTPPDFYQNQMGCTAKNVIHSDNKYRLDFVCTNTQLKGSGSAEGTFLSAESFKGKTQFKGFAQGNSVNEKADISGQWINASCGNVKPLQQ